MKFRKFVELLCSWKIIGSDIIYSGIIRNYAGDLLFVKVRHLSKSLFTFTQMSNFDEQ